MKFIDALPREGESMSITNALGRLAAQSDLGHRVAVEVCLLSARRLPAGALDRRCNRDIVDSSLDTVAGWLRGEVTREQVLSTAGSFELAVDRPGAGRETAYACLAAIEGVGERRFGSLTWACSASPAHGAERARQWLDLARLLGASDPVDAVAGMFLVHRGYNCAPEWAELERQGAPDWLAAYRAFYARSGVGGEA